MGARILDGTAVANHIPAELLPALETVTLRALARHRVARALVDPERRIAGGAHRPQGYRREVDGAAAAPQTRDRDDLPLPHPHPPAGGVERRHSGRGDWSSGVRDR